MTAPNVTVERTEKPLGAKAYGSIPHLPGSRMGPGDHHCHEGQARIMTEKVRDRHDHIVVQEKLDGSCVAVANIDGVIVPLIRAGYPAMTSHYEQHHLFAAWAFERQVRFLTLLGNGDRVVGEWLAQAHGTRYDLSYRDPFVAFDIMRGTTREPADAVRYRCARSGFTSVPILSAGPAVSIARAMELVGTHGHHGALDPVEGAVWRHERQGDVVMLAKYVRPDKVDGSYFDVETWNWRPQA